jgi:chromosome segregation ATPase
MPSRLDDLSVAIGDIKASLRTLFERGREDREQRSRDHRDNQRALGELRQDTQRAISELQQTATNRYSETTRAVEGFTAELGELRQELRNHAAAVTNMQPQIQSLQVSRGKLVTLAGVGVLALWLVAKAIELGVQQIFAWAFKKFGG